MEAAEPSLILLLRELAVAPPLTPLIRLTEFSAVPPWLTNITQIYDPDSNTWSNGPNMNVIRWWVYGTTVGNDSIVAPGGRNANGIGLNDNEQFIDPSCGTPTPTPTATATATPTPTATPQFYRDTNRNRDADSDAHTYTNAYIYTQAFADTKGSSHAATPPYTVAVRK